MPYVASRKDTLLIPSGPAAQPHALHLFVVMTDVCRDNRHLLVSLSTIRSSFHDPACIVRAGEHDFIKADSYVDYQHARTDHTRHLTKCVDDFVFFSRPPISEALYARIAGGLKVSRFATPANKAYFARNRPRET